MAPYWRVAWQQLTGKTQYEIGTYGMHMRSSPSAITNPDGTSLPLQDYLHRLGVRYADRSDTLPQRRALVPGHVYSRKFRFAGDPDSAGRGFGGRSPSEHRHGECRISHRQRVSGTFGWFNTTGTSDATLLHTAPVSGSAQRRPERCRLHRELLVLAVAEPATLCAIHRLHAL